MTVVAIFLFWNPLCGPQKSHIPEASTGELGAKAVPTGRAPGLRGVVPFFMCFLGVFL